jgi:hypothetical protein
MSALVQDPDGEAQRDFRDEGVKPIAIGRHDRSRGGDGLRVVPP